MSDVLQRLDAEFEGSLSTEEQQVLDAVKGICRDIAERAEDFDRTGTFPWSNIEAINALGLNTMFLPEEYGGYPLSFRCYLACVREIAKACASTAIVWATNFHAIKPVVEYASDAQKRRFLPVMAEGGLAALAITEPSAGSDATGMTTRFVPDGDEIVITGSKTFITNGDVADLYLLFGKWSLIDDPRKAISVVVVEKGAKGLEVLRLEDKMGTRASSTAAISFDEVRVPRSNLIGDPGDGLPILFGSLNRSRPSIAAHALGIARAAFEEATAYINERRQSGRAIIEFQGIQFMVADLAVDLAMCETWLWRVAAMVDGGQTDFGIEASMAKMRASDLAMQIATDAVQLLGGYGYTRDYRVERLMRDAKITQIWEGTNQIHRQLVGRSFLRK
ncbi:acyl-CoA dehydrogenase family protein [Novosphingobium mangrovi (ex Huang et al. 2023)]|uniref:Acyl-CoA dehydrogenase family protein n=1 Tax=Novosphingobium mangrovi (ex Huang et al. 2023) TaxID=2976432 RepID=A0ABT2I8R0_9SPHN|nr:acyl-CoA dehydrogenase family protein [Novosphingobium mangrovi (ex Huang et al. 2023)]MCT2401210.1 acyl-CoA dehydrogenase family protein [Novosphingobium mangrovi (ex Huang et al. 2023)]